jgi:ATP-dependent helicase/nuclease subunit B
VRLQRAARLLERRRAPIAQWLTLLTDSLMQIGVCGEGSALAADAAGEQLLELLAKLRDELAGDTLAISFADWRRWLGRALETATFRDRSIDSPVVFTFLAATPLRSFDAVIIAGADAAHLPGAESVTLFFNQNVRAELGLRTRAAEVQETLASLRALIVSCGDVLVSWQRTLDGEPNLLSPFFERLNALHALAYGATLDDDAAAVRAALAIVTPASSAAPPAATVQPAPPAAAALIPQQISASGYNALMACPYQYYARHMLRLAELDDVQELIDKADYGNAVHAALTAFHCAHPLISDLAPAAALQALESATDAAFREAVAANYLARAWLARWKPLIPQYLEWQRVREAEGWRFHAGEAKQELQITTPQGRTLLLRGRIDRVDQGRDNDGAVSVIDYKTQRQEVLRKKLAAPGEDVQLPVYALLWGGPVAAALFLSLEREGVKDVALKEDINLLAQETSARLGLLHDALHAGAPMPAQGVDAVCQYCEMDGLCRRSHWP